MQSSQTLLLNSSQFLLDNDKWDVRNGLNLKLPNEALVPSGGQTDKNMR